jgi:putative ABC transport system permease protein
VTAALRERLPETGARDGGAPARRAVMRWALRLFRREWRQQLMVLTLITVAVAATIFGAAVATNTPLPANAGFGSANALISLPATKHLAADIAAIRAHFGPVDVIENQTFATGLVQGAQLRAQNPNGAYGRPMLALVSGHYPSGSGQVALTSGLASAFRVGIGGVWHVDGRALRVTGIVENPQNLLDTFALVAPGQVTGPSQVTVLLHATPLSIATFNLPPGATALQPQPPSGLTPAVIALVFAVVGLFFIGLVAVAGFTVLAQRRLRSLGVLSSLGATDKHVRLVMVANGAVVGVIGALLGGVIGLAAWIPYAPYFGTHADHRVAWSNLPWWLVGLAMALAVVTAILASRQPARAVAEVPVVAALSGRPAEPKQSRRSPRPGLIALALGIALIAFSGGLTGGSGAGGGSSTFDALAGLLATVAGLVLLAPVIIGTMAPVARRVPIAARIAVRDLARYRARSGAALAAATLAVFIAMLIALLTTNRYSEPIDYEAPNLPPNQLVVYAPNDNPAVSSGDVPPTARQERVGRSTTATIAAALGSRDVLPLTAAVAPTGVVLEQVRAGSESGTNDIYVATPALLRHYGIMPSAIGHGTVLVTSRPGLQGSPDLVLEYGNITLPNAALKYVPTPPIQTFTGLPTDLSDPNLLITAPTAARLGLRQATVAWLIQTPRSLTSLQISSASRVAAAAGLTIETKNGAPSLNEVRDTATAAGILVALCVLAMTIGLIRSETAADIRTLTATGASARTRRGVVAATAGALGVLGALSGTVAAYLAVLAGSWHQLLAGYVSPVPWQDLVAVLVGLPLAAAVGGWLLAGREPSALARQPLE